MSINSTLLKYISLEKQYETIEQLIIHDNDLEHAFEIINITGSDIFNNRKTGNTDLTDYLFQKIVKHINYFLSLRDNRFDSIESIQDIFLNDYKEFILLLKFVYILPNLTGKLNNFILSLLVNYINDYKDCLFQNNNNNISISKILSLLSNNNPTDIDTNNIINPLNHKQIVVLLKLLEIIYIQNTNSQCTIITATTKNDNKVTNLIDKCILLLLSCDIESIALQCSKLMRWRQDIIIQEIHLSSSKVDSEFDIDNLLISYLINVFLDQYKYNWKLRIFLIFLSRCLNYENIPKQLTNILESDDFVKFLQFSLNHDIIEYRKISLSLLKVFINKLFSSNETNSNLHKIDSTKFKWDPVDNSKIKMSWDKFIKLYETISLDSQINKIKLIRKDIIDLFNDKFIDGSWGLILFSTSFKSSSMKIKQYMISLMFDIKNKNNFFYSDLSLTQSILLPTIMNNPYCFKTLCVDTNESQANVCPHGDSISNLFYEILEDSNNDQRSIMIETMLNIIIETDFIPAKIYGVDGIYKYLRSSNIPIFNNKHLFLIKQLFANKCEVVIWDVTLKSLLLKTLNYINHECVPLIDWLHFMAFCFNQCCFKNENEGGVDMTEYPAFAIEFNPVNQWYQDENSILQKHLGSDPMFDALCIIFFNVEIMEYDVILLATVARLMKTFPKLNKNAKLNKLYDSIVTTLNQLLTPEMLNNLETDYLYRYACDIVFYNDLLTTIKKSINIYSLFDHITTSFSENKSKFLVSLCEKCDFKLSIDYDKYDILYSTMVKFIDTQNMDIISKDSLYGDFFKLIRLTVDWHSCGFGFCDKILTITIGTDFCKNANHLYTVIEIIKLCSFIEEAANSENPQIQFKCFEIGCNIWDSLNKLKMTTSIMKPLRYLIKFIFTPNNIFIAVSDPHSLQRQNIDRFIKQLCDISFTQIGFLPILSQQFELFFKKYNHELNTSTDYTWLSSMLVLLFIQEPTEEIKYQLESVISYLYDKTFFDSSKDYVPLYKTVYGVPEIFSKVSIIAGLISSGPSFQLDFINYLIKQNDILGGDKNTERERIFKWQSMLVSLYLSCKNQLTPEIGNFTESVLLSLESENSMETRIYKEWFIAYCLSILYKNDTILPDLDTLLFNQLGDHSKPLLVVSIERIIFLVLKIQNENISRKLLTRFLYTIVSNATSNKPLVRHFTNSLITLFWPIFKEQLQSHPMKDILENLFNNAKGKPKSGSKVRTGDAKAWDLYNDLTLSGIFGNVCTKILGQRQNRIPSKVFEEYDKRDNKFKGIFPIGKIEDESLPTTIKEYSINWNDDSISKNSKRSELIVVASLVDKPFNLGGICRLCDVLGAKTVTVQDLRVKDSPQFKDVSLSSEKWISMEEVGLDSISSYMQEKKAEGYTLIGLEQTDKSIRLDGNFKFPSKSLILLGTEAYGIPGPLLKELDLCLEIQQHGVIRSMNIQTATAVIVHSYTIQHL